jgi:AraC family transcriptional regulator of adaptative response/methylated-DNA-[protein]-cysteine methyltransferase
MLNPETCWEALLRRDRQQDGRFFFSVITTGVYCRPSCAARRPLRKNVRFYETPALAERDGLRPCLRCRPLGPADAAEERIREACRYIEEHCDETLTIQILAARAGLSAFHFQRTFKAAAGVTPKQFQAAARTARLKNGLRNAKEVTEAVYEAGYGSASRVYEHADAWLGMTPRQYREKGRGVSISYASVETAVGWMMIGASDRGLCFVQFGDSPEDLLGKLRKEYPAASCEPSNPVSSELKTWIDALNCYLSGVPTLPNLALDIRATAFQTRVWKYLQTIPYGQVQSYGEVAEGLGAPKAARAVAQACASNTIALVIPCHRVIRGTGEMGGYRWGLDRKRALIDSEHAS